MIDNLRELNETINKVVQRMVEVAADKITSSTPGLPSHPYLSHSDVADLISFEDYLHFSEIIASELNDREEVLDVDLDGDQLTVGIDPKYCPNHARYEGTEFQSQPVSQPLDLTRLADIGKNAIPHILATSDTAIEDLTESLGMSMAELEQLGIYEFGEPEPPVFLYEVVDVKNGKLAQFQDFDEALVAYDDLGDTSGKYVAAIIPEGQPHEGAVYIMQQQGEHDVLCNVRTDLPHVKNVQDYLADTPVNDAFARARQYMEEKYPILYYVYREDMDMKEAAPMARFEAALDEYQRAQGERSLGYLVFNEQVNGRGGIILQMDSDMPSRSHVCALSEQALENPHVALAYSKAVLSMYPNDEKSWAMRDKAEAELGITDRVVDISNDLIAGKWRVHFVPPGGRYGSHNQLINDRTPPRSLTEFYDMSQNKEVFPHGQFTGGRYYTIDLLGQNDYPFGLNIDSAIPSWSVSRDEMKEVLSYLRQCEDALKPDRSHYRGTSLIDKIYEAESRQGRPFVPSGTEKASHER